MATKACDVCGKEFEPQTSSQKRCGQVCMEKAKLRYRRAYRGVGKKTRKCDVCGKEFVLRRHRANQKRCGTECRGKASREVFQQWYQQYREREVDPAVLQKKLELKRKRWRERMLDPEYRERMRNYRREWASKNREKQRESARKAAQKLRESPERVERYRNVDREWMLKQSQTNPQYRERKRVAAARVRLKKRLRAKQEQVAAEITAALTIVQSKEIR